MQADYSIQLVKLSMYTSPASLRYPSAHGETAYSCHRASSFQEDAAAATANLKLAAAVAGGDSPARTGPLPPATWPWPAPAPAAHWRGRMRFLPGSFVCLLFCVGSAVRRQIEIKGWRPRGEGINCLVAMEREACRNECIVKDLKRNYAAVYACQSSDRTA